MKNLVKLALFGLLACLMAPQCAEARLIQAGFNFDANDDSDVSSISQTITTPDGQFTFDITVMMSSVSGTVVDTSRETTGSGVLPGQIGQRAGISVTAADNLIPSQTISFSVAVTPISGTKTLSDLTFRYLGTTVANGSGSRGTLITPAGSSSWQDANSLPADFVGHFPGGESFGSGNISGFLLSTATGQTAGSFSTGPGFDIPISNVANGGGALVTSFSHRTDLGSYRLNDVVVQVRATPEPSSLLFGLVAAFLGMWRVGWRQTLQLVGLRRGNDLATT